MQKLSKEQKELQGTYEPSKEGIEPVEFEDYERCPTAPDGWPPKAQKIWEDRCRDLKNAGYLKKAMMAPLRRYCFAVYQAELAEKMLLEDGEYNGFVVEQIGTEGQTYEKLSTWLQVLDNANKTIEKFGAKFGFTPLDSFKVPKLVKEQKTLTLLK
jgi:phage terminase small subunit